MSLTISHCIQLANGFYKHIKGRQYDFSFRKNAYLTDKNLDYTARASRYVKGKLQGFTQKFIDRIIVPLLYRCGINWSCHIVINGSYVIFFSNRIKLLHHPFRLLIYTSAFPLENVSEMTEYIKRLPISNIKRTASILSIVNAARTCKIWT